MDDNVGNNVITDDVFQIHFEEFMNRRPFVPPLDSDSKSLHKTILLLAQESCFCEDSRDMKDFKDRKESRPFTDTKQIDRLEAKDQSARVIPVATRSQHDGNYQRDHLFFRSTSHSATSSSLRHFKVDKNEANSMSQNAYNTNHRQGKWTETPSARPQGNLNNMHGGRYSYLDSVDKPGNNASSQSMNSCRYFSNGFKSHHVHRQNGSKGEGRYGSRNGDPYGCHNKNQYRTDISHSSNQERKKIGNGSNLSRSIIALLNKVSSQNIYVLRERIIQMCTNEENTEQVVKFILQKMHNEYSFIHLYIDIMKHIPDQFTPVMKRCCLTLIANFLLTLPDTIGRITQNIEGENNLSKFIKAKKEIYDMNKAICVLILKSFIEMKPLLYLSNVKQLFDQINTGSSCEIYDIFIHIMYDFFMINVSIELRDEAKPMVSLMLEDKSANKDICCKRTDFKWNDLLDLIQYGESTRT